MSIKVGINGFGRIGRMVFRASLNHPEIDFSHFPSVFFHRFQEKNT